MRVCKDFCPLGRVGLLGLGFVLVLSACDGSGEISGGNSANGGGSGGSAGSGGTGGTGGSGGGGTGGSGGPAGCEAAPPARCWYVALTGDDAAAGTITAPLRHVWKGVSSARPGDFIYLRAGVWRLTTEATTSFCGENQTHRGSIISIRDTVLYGTGGSGEDCVSSWPSYTVASGTPSAPITLSAYPGEHVVLDSELSNTELQSPPYIIVVGGFGWGAHRAYWTIRGLDIVGAVYVQGNGLAADHTTDPNANTNHIILEQNEIHDVMSWGGNNAGMIKIDRGDWGGPYEITIRHNHIHHMRDNGFPDWRGTTDSQHFGAVTTLSAQGYLGVDKGGTGRIVIEDNRIHDLPAAFFFKNPAAGPLEIRRNRIWNVQWLGNENTSNLLFENNLVYDAGGGFSYGYGPSDSQYDLSVGSPLYALAGQNAVLRNNTLVGGAFGSCRSGTGHTLEHNLVYGLPGRVPGATWDTWSLLAQSYAYPDTVDPAQSHLQSIRMDNNCYATPYADFQAVSRYLPSTVEHYGIDQARSIFHFDLNSRVVITGDPSGIFTDYGNHNFAQPANSPCAGYGADISSIPPE